MVMSWVLVYIIKVIPWLILNIFLRLGSEESYQDSSKSEVEVTEVTKNAEVAEDTAIMVEPDNEISFLSDFLDDSVSLEAEGFNNIIKEILTEEKIEEEVKSCMNDVIDNVEKLCNRQRKGRISVNMQSINLPGL